MTKVLLSIHVLAAIIAIGPVTVAASMFPAAIRRAAAEPTDPSGAAVLRNLHRICRVYAVLGVLVPVFGLATASSLGVLGDAWLIISIVLTAAAAAVLAFLVLPGQAAALAGLDRGPQPVLAGGSQTAAAQDRPSAPPVGPGAGSDTTPERPTPSAKSGAGSSTASGSPDGAIRPARIAARLGMVTGIFNLLWAVVVVLMIVRPGSTTGA